MRTTRAFLLAILALGLLVPLSASAAHLTIVGSLTITGAGGAALTTQLVGVAIIANPGLEKNSTIQIPPFVLPIVIDGEDGGPSAPAGSKLLSKNLDTALILTNTTGSSLPMELTLRDGAGTLLTPSPVTVTLGAHATKVIVVSDLLP